MSTERLMEPAVYHAGVEGDEVLRLAAEHFFTPEERAFRTFRMENKGDFQQVYGQWLPLRNFEWFAQEIVRRTPDKLVRLPGRCAVCGQEEAFLVRPRGDEVNWAEQIICPSCQCNARSRYWISQIVEQSAGGKFFVLERNQNERKHISRLLGSRADLYAWRTAGQSDPVQGKLNLEHLPYGDGSLSFCGSYDFLETVEHPEVTLREMARVLQPGGRMLLHTLFDANADETVARAVRRDGQPVSDRGLWYRDPGAPEKELTLVWHVFGWDLLETIRQCGFGKVYAVTHYSISDGYMGYLPVWIEAVR